MFRSIASRVALIILLALLVGYYDLPANLQGIPGTPDSVKSDKVILGLDLQGGSQLDYNIDLRKVPQEKQKEIINGVREVINRRVNSLGVSEPNIYTSKVGNEEHLIVELAGIKDLDEAKKVVGKTIQLEFKEKRETADPNVVATVKKTAQTALDKIKANPSSFDTVGQQEQQANAGKVSYLKGNWEFVDGIVYNTRLVLEKMKDGEISNEIVEGSNGYTFDGKNLEEQKGVFIYRKDGSRSTANLPANEKELMVSHILVQYKGADKAADTITRSKEDAKKVADEILGRIQKGEKFDDLAKSSSDEPGAKDSAGKLTGAVKQGGQYDAKFTEASLALTSVGQLSPVTETPFGFHIIRADSFDQLKYSQIFYNTADDPWQETGLNGEHFEKAEVVFDQLMQPTVSIKFDAEGGKLFEKLTEKNVGKPIAIYVGGNLISAPNVNEKITGGNAVINGMSGVQEAQDLARDLNTGAIPAPITLSGQYTIGATLGQEALNKSIYAGIVGIAVLALAMILYYRLPGLIAVIALSLYTAVMLFLVKSSLPTGVAVAIALVVFVGILYKILNSKDGGWEKFISFILACFILFFLSFLLKSPIVLTLAGVAGVILSVGMAVDANILIFERVKEELRAGRPISSAIDVGFDRAWSSIRDSNFSSLLTCAILFYFGTSIIQGFAFNLAAGILVSMFTAITITKTLLLAVMKTPLGGKLWLWGIASNKAEAKPLKIVEKAKIWFGFSGAIIAVSLIVAIVFGLHLSIDFKGGSLLDLKFEKQVSVDAIRGVLAAIDTAKNAKGATAPAPAGQAALTATNEKSELAAARIISSGDNSYQINTQHVDNETHDRILADLKAKFGTVTENRFTTIGPVVGETLKSRAIVAVLVAMVMIIIYISFAFRKIPKKFSPWKFGLCAIVALLHDIFIPIGVFAALQLEVDALFITALLTVLGFSVHDTIVVFDRIRENLKYQQRGETFKDVANKSLTQTMARSINTSLSTLITLVALLIFGAPSIFNFVLVLVIGIVVGTYSSIFIASPLLVKWQKDE